MARPTKQGLEYFPVDVEFDDKIELLISELGSDALSVLMTVWQLIYKENGYYIMNGKDLYLLVRRRIMINIKTIEDIINVALDRGIFNKEICQKYGILTSRGIQKRFFFAASRKKMVNVYKNYLLVGVNDYNNITVSGINVSNNATKESKVKESKVKEKSSSRNFEQIWERYPIKDGKKAAKKHFLSSVKTKKDFENINKALDNYMNSEKFKDGFIKNGSTWFNNWQDWINWKEPKSEPKLDKWGVPIK